MAEILFSTSGNLQGRIVYNYTQNTSANTSTISAVLYARKTTSTATYGKSWSGNITIDGQTSSFSSMPSSTSVSNSWVQMHAFTKTVTHNNDGTKSVVISGSIKGPSGTALANNTSSGSATVTLPQIARGATVTASLSSKSYDEIVVNWNSSAVLDYFWWTTVRNPAYTDFHDGRSTSGTSGSFTLSGLEPSTTYYITVRGRRSDNKIETNSNTLTVTTDSKPSVYLLSVTDFQIGESPDVEVSNAKDVRYEIDLVGNNNIIIGSYAGHSEYPSISMNDDNAYKSIPNGTSGNYTAKLYFDDTLVSSATGKYTIDPSKCRPIFTNTGITYKDTNPVTLALTNDESMIIKGYSTVEVTIPKANVAKGNKYATIKNYLTNGTIRTTWANADTTITIPNFNADKITITANDSRSNTTTIEKEVKFHDYIPVTKERSYCDRSSDGHRIDGIGEYVCLELYGKYWNKSFGDVQNTLTATYRYRKKGDTDWITDGKTGELTSLLNIEEDGSFSYNGSLLSNTSDGKFDVSTSYQFEILLTDSMGTVTLSFEVTEGSPAYDLFGNSIGLAGQYDESVEDRIQALNDINMMGNLIKNLANPINDSDAINKSFADNNFVKLTGNQAISGTKTFNTLPQSSATPSSDNQLVNKKYVDSATAGTVSFGNDGYVRFSNGLQIAWVWYNVTAGGNEWNTATPIWYSDHDMGKWPVNFSSIYVALPVINSLQFWCAITDWSTSNAGTIRCYRPNAVTASEELYVVGIGRWK